MKPYKTIYSKKAPYLMVIVIIVNICSPAIAQPDHTFSVAAGPWGCNDMTSSDVLGDDRYS